MLWLLVELPDCQLIHYGKREVLARIEAMEEEYNEPLVYVDPGPAVPGAGPTGDPSKPWCEGITVCGPAQLLKGRLNLSLMADSYGFRGEEEWTRMQKYLKAHEGWQLEQVGLPVKVTGHLPFDVVTCHTNLLVTCTIVKLSDFPGEWHGELPICRVTT